MLSRRYFFTTILTAIAAALGAVFGYKYLKKKDFYQSNADLKMWLAGDAHLNQSVEHFGYNCLQEPIADMDRIGFEYDLALNVGDFDSAQFPPTENGNGPEGELVVAALTSSPKHDRADFYCISGNHDAGDGEMDWFEKYIDILGENPAYSKNDPDKRPYPIRLMEEGEWHSYYIEIGNLLIFMLSDRNSLPGPFGRGGMVHGKGGYPSGTISKKTWEWFKASVLDNKDKNIFVCSHQGVRNTVIATGDNEGDGFHGKSGIPDGRGSIYTIYDEAAPANSLNGTDVIKTFFADNPDHTVRLWMSGHTHTRVGAVRNGRGIRHREHGVDFLNVCSLTSTWIGPKIGHIDSRSWTCELTDRVVNLRCFVHRPVQEKIQKGFQPDLEFSIELAHPFIRSAL